jgi:hypothetical protein
MLNRFDFCAAFARANEAQMEILKEAQRDFVALFPLQARIQERVRRHILEGAFREQAMLKHWKANKPYIELPENVIKALYGCR